MNTNQSMTGFIKESAKDLNSTKLLYNSRSFTTAQVFADVSSVATFLRTHGVGKGDSVIICLPNIVQAVVAVYAINAAGAVANIAHPKIGTDGLIRIAEESNTKWLFIFDRFYRKHKKALKENGIKAIVCRISDCAGTGLKLPRPPKGKDAYSYNSTLVKPIDFDLEIDGKDPAVYLHSSGTTGDSKTVVLSNLAMNELAVNIHDCVKPADGTTMLMALPIFHGFGLGVCLHLMMMFGKIALLPAFSAKKAINTMRRREINYMAVVPNMLRRLVAQKSFSGKKLAGLKEIFVGGDKLDEGLKKEAEKIMAKSGSSCRICEGYGLSETASVTHINIDRKDGGTVGKPIGGVKVKIVSDGKEAASGEDGEIYISSNSMMNGYLKGEADFEIDENGVKWLKTGDLGHVDDEGYLYYRGREKRLVKIGGVNIFPQEIENAADEIEEIVNSCAVRTLWNGKPAVRLLVELKDGEKLTSSLKQKISDVITSKIMPYAAPKYIETEGKLKMTGMGKTDYRYYEEREPKQ